MKVSILVDVFEPLIILVSMYKVYNDTNILKSITKIKTVCLDTLNDNVSGLAKT